MKRPAKRPGPRTAGPPKARRPSRGVPTGGRPLGRYVTSDPGIHHGEPVFAGTRIRVADVLEQVASGMAWDAIVEEWRGAVRKEAIAEAVRLAREALVASAPDAPGTALA